MRSILLCLALAAPAFAGSVRVISTSPRLVEGAVAVSPIHPNVVIAAAIGGDAAPEADVHMFRSTDGGQTWTPMGELVKRLDDRAVIGHWDPVMAFDRSGRAYIAVVAAVEPMTWTIAVYRSTDEGVTWNGVEVSSPEVARNDKPWIAVADDGSIHVAWYQLHAAAPGLTHAVSRDGGLTYSTPRTFGSFGWPYVTAGPGNEVYLSYLSDAGYWELVRSSDGGVTFGSPSRIEQVRGGLPLQLVADRSHGPHRGNLYAFIPANDGVYFTRSTDRGLTWMASAKVSGSGGAMMPSIDVDPSTGEIVFAWYERQSSTRAQLYATRSRDGGQTLEPRRAVSDAFHASGPVGEYNQLAAVGGVHIVVYGHDASAFSAARLDDGGTPEPVAPRRRRAVRH